MSKSTTSKTDPPDKPEKENPETKAKRIKNTVKKQVLKAIGTPKDLHKVDIHLYDPGIARINIWRNKKKEKNIELIQTKVVLTDSYYLWLTKTAKIKKSNPPMNPKY